MDSFKHRFLKGFGKIRRPVAWIIYLAGLISFVVVMFDIIKTGDAKFASLLGAVLLTNDGFQMVSEEEDNADSPAATE